MAKYSKFIASILGSVVGFVLAFLASKGLGTCDAVGENCVVFGMTQESVMVLVMGALSALGVLTSPKNTE